MLIKGKFNKTANMKNVIGNLIFVVILIIIIARFATVFNGATFPANVIASSSMEPVLKKGDIVIWIPASMDDVKEGDIVVYRSIYGHIVIHRVVEKRDGGLITKGDANNYTDQSGPHVPEPIVRQQNLLGKVIMVKNLPIKIPFIGNFWLLLKDIAAVLAEPLRYSHGNGEKFVIFLPFIFSLSLFMLLIIFWLPNGKSEEQKLHELILGPDKISAAQLLRYILLIFVPFLLLSSFFAYDSMEVNGKKEFPVFNPSLLSVKGFSFIEGGNASTEEKIFKLKGGEVRMIGINGEGGKVFIYSSPYWLLIPDKIMNTFYSLGAETAVCLSSLLAALIMSILTFFLLISISFIMEKIILFRSYVSFLALKHHVKFISIYRIIARIKSKINIFGEQMKNMLIWMEALSGSNKRVLILSLSTIAFLPLIIKGAIGLLYTLFLSSITLSILIYFAGCRFKNEIAFAALISSATISSAFMFKIFYYGEETFVAFLQYIAIFFILLLLIFFLQFMIMLLFIALFHLIREKFDPAALLEVCDI